MNNRIFPLLALACGVTGAVAWVSMRANAPARPVDSDAPRAAKTLPAPVSDDKLARATGAEVPFRPSGEPNVEVRFVPRSAAASDDALPASRTPRRKDALNRRSAPVAKQRNRPKIIYNPAGGAVAILDKSWRTSTIVKTGADGKPVMACKDASHLNANGSHNAATHKKAAATRRP